ncbi:hypothetical protein [Amphritea japonica]|uniref:Uncharacterized protein n=1 Tax=Amphritea japonica ATCC BAA-1530 TaxID=1278309 RepID=A0A7R6P511_9GAMM|nr:hypothetical protein [Amphritea japonica]BBB27453.1 conserved hypothetical protein [Amphritea japonica ATCC BAA-1530]
MAQLHKTWDSEQLKQMNEEAFLVDLLDMIQISPTTDSSDSAIKLMQSKLDVVEAMLRERLNG